MRGVEGHPASAGLVDGEDGDDEPERLLEADVDKVVDLDAVLVHEVVGETVGGAVELGVGHLVVPALDGELVGTLGGLPLELGVEQVLNGLGLVLAVPLAGLLEVPGSGDGEGRDGVLALGEELLHDVLVLVRQGIHEDVVEDVAVVDEDDLDRLVRDAALDDQRVREVVLHEVLGAELARVVEGEDGVRVARDAGQLRSRLDDEQAREVDGLGRVLAQLGNLLQTVLLVGDHVEGLVLNLLEVVRDGLVAAEADPDGDGGNGRTGHVSQVRNRGLATGDGGAKGDIVGLAVAGEDDTPGGTEDGGLGDGAAGRLGEVDLAHGHASRVGRLPAGLDSGRGPGGALGTLELLGPVGLRVLALDAHGVLDEAGVGGKAGLVLLSLVGEEERTQDELGRPTVVDGVVHDPGEEELAILLDDAIATQAVAIAHLDGGGVLHEGGDGGSTSLPLDVVLDVHLDGDATADLHDAGAEVGAQLHGALPRALEAFDVDKVGQLVDVLGNVGAGLLLGQGNHTLLDGGDGVSVLNLLSVREVALFADGLGVHGVALGLGEQAEGLDDGVGVVVLADAHGLGGDGVQARVVEDILDRDLDAGLTGAGDELDGEDGITTNAQEGVVLADGGLVDAQELGPDGLEANLHGGVGLAFLARHERVLGQLRLRQLGEVRLEAVAVQLGRRDGRHVGAGDVQRGHHVARQGDRQLASHGRELLLQLGVERDEHVGGRRGRLVVVGEREVGHERSALVTLVHVDSHLGHAGEVLADVVLDLGQLDTQTANLDLRILTGRELDGTIGVPATQITRLVEAAPVAVAAVRCPSREAGHDGLGGPGGIGQVLAEEGRTLDNNLTQGAGRSKLGRVLGINDPAETTNRLTYRHGRLVGRGVLVNRRQTAGLGRTPTVDEAHLADKVLEDVAAQSLTADEQEFQGR